MPALVTVKLRWGAASLSVFTISSCPSGTPFPATAATSPTIMHQGLIQRWSICGPGLELVSEEVRDASRRESEGVPQPSSFFPP